MRDEFVGRPFDDPGQWWPDRPGVVGGRDRTAGGTWCASAVGTGTTALVLNRPERREGSPSRGILPLAALAAADAWPDGVDVSTMASFNLVLVGPVGARVWTWDGTELRSAAIGDGTHLITPRGLDPDDARTTEFAPRFAQEPWQQVVESSAPSSAESALVVRHEVGDRTYATVFGQLITAVPGRLDVRWSRTPWQAGSWTDRTWTEEPAGDLSA